MYGIDNIECIGPGGINVDLDGGRLSRVLDIDEVQHCRRLARGRGLATLERDRIVSSEATR